MLNLWAARDVRSLLGAASIEPVATGTSGIEGCFPWRRGGSEIVIGGVLLGLNVGRTDAAYQQ